MREDFDELTETTLKQDLQTLNEDVDKLREDVAKLMWKSTLGQAQRKIARRPITSVAWAFVGGFLLSGLLSIFRSNKDC